ncbi:ABC transporter substrate-binding protein [Longispora fulva]|uniref:Iron complex transport system substrate-binding protein n=1 Tax=Longispora fulva TaxID=619741 RepID=A0A8J7GQV0_9ACTN|nr:iron-siderophore ABC transporter substrate-binding protein [Longispora fulva]MBG6135256.1 iron complex transport system substrate-binding protein [Longispora fulva]GIG56507.1 ABC transporter substrate-binding protein [Longispora fulva]
MKKFLPVALAALVAASLLSACGGSAKGGTSSPAGGGFPVTVEHKYGKTEVRKAPTRVVTLGLSDQDTVLALGIRPVGVVDWFKERPFGKWPWAQPLWGDSLPEIVGERDDYQFEKIAALRPDLIVAQYSGMKKDQYETLSKIAPVVAQSAKHDDYAAPWQEMTRVIGRALGREARVDELIAGIEKRFADVRAAHPEFAKQTVVVAESYEPGKYSVFSPADPKTVFLKELGFRPSEAIGKLAGTQSFADIGSERLDLLDVDRLLWVIDDPDAEKRIQEDPVYAKLAVVTAGRAVFVPYTAPPAGAALSFDTVLSIPYAIDQLVPLLSK